MWTRTVPSTSSACTVLRRFRDRMTSTGIPITPSCPPRTAVPCTGELHDAARSDLLGDGGGELVVDEDHAVAERHLTMGAVVVQPAAGQVGQPCEVVTTGLLQRVH